MYLQLVTNIIINDHKLSPIQEWIINYLKDKGWCSPTLIGNEYGKLKDKPYHSSWASPKCKKLVDMGILKRNSSGHYRLKHNLKITKEDVK